MRARPLGPAKGQAHRIWLPLVAMMVATLISACSIVDTSPVFEPTGYYPVPDRNCESSLGSYVLPKTKLVFTVVQNTTSKISVLKDVTTLRVADDPQRYTFCLDFLENWFADDKVQVRRTKATDALDGATNRMSGGFLDLVATHSVDMTGVVLTKIIRAIFIYLSGNNGFISGRSAADLANSEWQPVLVPTLDPFDAESMAQWNKSLRRYGFCIALADYSYDIDAIGYESYCSDPVGIEKAHPSPRRPEVAAIRNAPIKAVTGIYYRPRIAYPVTIFVNSDPLGRGEWRPGKTVYVEMENISPVLGLRLNRAMFAVKKTAIIFEEGRLRNVCLVKGSEVAGAIMPVIELATSLVQLPSATITAEITRLTKSQAVYDAETKVIAMQNRLIELRQAQIERNADAIAKLAQSNAFDGATTDGGLVYSGKRIGDETPSLTFDEPSTSVTTTEIDGICKKLTGNGTEVAADDTTFTQYFDSSFTGLGETKKPGTP